MTIRRVAGMLSIGLLAACLDDIELPPEAPVLLPIISPVRTPTVLLQGTKPANTGILLGKKQIVKPSAAEAWSSQLALDEGENKVSLRSVTKSGLESLDAATATIVYESDFPPQPTLEEPITPTNEATQTLTGTTPEGTRVVLLFLASGAEQELAAASDDTEWAASITLVTEGKNALALVAEDARGRRSEPVDFTIDYDVTAPAIATKYPEGPVAMPTNGVLSIAFDAPLTFEAEQVPPEVVTVRNGIADVTEQGVTLSVSYQAGSRALRVRPSPAWPADVTLTVSLNHALVTDLAGNQNAQRPGDWIWTFTTGSATDTTPPPAPTITVPTGDNLTIQTSAAHLEGQKPAATAVLVNGEEVVSVDASTSWTLDWPLAIDSPTTLTLTLMTVTEQFGPEATRTFTREVVRPNPPTLDPPPPDEVDEPAVQLQGARDPNTSVLLNGRVVVPRSPDATWSYNAELVPGLNVLRLQSKSVQDGVEVLSDPLEVAVTFALDFSGDTPADFGLVLSYGLRNLDDVDPIRGEFETGPSNYAVDVWLEGPLEEGEQCSFDAASKERRDVKYAATLVHYKGEKAGHTNPWGDDDYANPDYVAALVTSGVLGFDPAIDRRDDNTGMPADGLTAGGARIAITQEQVDTAIDGVTQATQKPGQKIITWPDDDAARRFDGERLPQGEYVLHAVVSLDRSGAWVSDNDEETCWGDADFVRKGQHRISVRVGLGDVPFSLALGQAAEESGPDAEEGKDVLRYFAASGLTVIWASLQ